MVLFGRSACTSIKLHEGLLVAAYGSAHLRLFSLVSAPPSLLCEVAAHARWITALDLAPHSSPLLILSAAEDSFVRVWEVIQGDRCTVCELITFINLRIKKKNSLLKFVIYIKMSHENHIQIANGYRIFNT